jgi:hypothetical protein
MRLIAKLPAGGLVLAAKRLRLSELPAVTIVDLDEARLRSLRLALNRLGRRLKLGENAVLSNDPEIANLCDWRTLFSWQLVLFIDAGAIERDVDLAHFEAYPARNAAWP